MPKRKLEIGEQRLGPDILFNPVATPPAAIYARARPGNPQVTERPRGVYRVKLANNPEADRWRPRGCAVPRPPSSGRDVG
jgi:hypothetical protein